MKTSHVKISPSQQTFLLRKIVQLALSLIKIWLRTKLSTRNSRGQLVQVRRSAKRNVEENVPALLHLLHLRLLPHLHQIPPLTHLRIHHPQIHQHLQNHPDRSHHHPRRDLRPIHHPHHRHHRRHRHHHPPTHQKNLDHKIIFALVL